MKLPLLIGICFLGATSFAQNQITWGTTLDVASSGFANNFPRITKDGAGDPIISWTDNNDMFFTRWNGSGFTTPITVSTVPIAGAAWMGPDIASLGDTVFAVYKESPEADSNSHVWCTSSFNGGVTFNTPVRVDYIGNNICRFPTVSVDDQGNPIVAFMRFDPSFGNARWVVARSNDLGISFSPDVLASGWSSGTSEVCDCCPSKIVSNGTTVAMPYRDNNSNIRDTWVGISNDVGVSFTGGMGVDQQNWLIMSCPSSGPDAVIIGDDLYTTFMSSATGQSRVSYSISSISGMTGSVAIPLDQTTPVSLISQNYPRVDRDLNSMAFVWKQFSNSTQELAIQFTADFTGGLNTIQEIVDFDNVGAVDVMLNNGTIWVIWEDDASGTVKYRSGSYTSSAGVTTIDNSILNLNAQPNPSSSLWTVTGSTLSESIHYELVSVNGHVVEQNSISLDTGNFNLELDNSQLKAGIYYLSVSNEYVNKTIKLVKL